MPCEASRSNGPTPAGVSRAAAQVLGVALVVEVAVFSVSTVPGVREAPGFDPVLDGWLQGAAYVTAALVCVLRPVSTAAQRRAWSWIAAGLVLRAIGFALFLSIVRRMDPQPYPSVADGAWLAMPVLMVVGLAGLLPRSAREFDVRLIIDAAIGGMAAVALGLWALDDTLRRLADDQQPSAVVVTNLAYPTTDALLVLVVVGVVAAARGRPPRQLLALGAGLSGFAVGDSIFLYQVSAGSFRPGTALSALALVSTACIAAAGWVNDRGAQPTAPAPVASIVVPLLGSVACLVVLVLGSATEVPATAVAIASTGIALGVMRTWLTFCQLRRVTADLQRKEVALRHSEERVRAESERVRTIIDGVTEHAIIGGDLERGISFFSAGAERMLGYTAEEVVGRTGTELFLLEDEVAAEAATAGLPPGPEAVAAAAGAPAKRWTLVRKDGSHVPVLMTINPLAGGGEHQGFVGIARDVSREIELERYRATREALVAELAGSSNDDRVLERAARIIGERMGWEFSALWLPEGDALRCVGLWRDRVDARPADAEVVSLRLRPGEGVIGRSWLSDRPEWIEDLGSLERRTPSRAALRDRLVPDDRTMVVIPLPAGAGRPPAGVLQLVGGRRARDEEVIALLGAIALTIGHHLTAQSATERLRAARDAERVANQTKSAFVSRISHELRTPLNAVLGFAQLIGRGLDDATQLSRIGHIIAAGRHLTQMIDDLLDLSQVESGELRVSVEPVLATSVLTEVIDLTRTLVTERGLEVRIDVHEGLHRYVEADYVRLRQVLLNLVSNAVKYNRPAGRITFSFEDRTDGRLRYLVTDTGPGIRVEDLPDLFQPFERLHDGDGGEPGAGLGLSLSRGLVRAMGGELGVSTVRGEGSTFFVELAQCAPPATLREEAVVVGRPARPLRPAIAGAVLLIEDNPVNVELLEELFVGYPAIDLAVATDATSGLQAASETPPDLVLLDLHLPDRPGLEVLRQLRTRDATRRTPVIVVSALAGDEPRRRCLAAGADDYLTKPLDLGALMAAVAGALSDPELEEPPHDHE